MTRDGKWKPETDAWTHTCQKIIRDPSQTANKLLTLTLQKEFMHTRAPAKSICAFLAGCYFFLSVITDVFCGLSSVYSHFKLQHRIGISLNLREPEAVLGGNCMHGESYIQSLLKICLKQTATERV